MPNRFGPIIARRELTPSLKEKGKVLVEIGTPRKIGKREWSCPFRILGIAETISQEAFGIDGVQALILALEGIRTNLQKSNIVLSWEGGERGDVGFPRFVPSFYGVEFSQKMGNIMDREILRFAKTVENNRSIQKGRGSEDKSQQKKTRTPKIRK